MRKKEAIMLVLILVLAMPVYALHERLKFPTDYSSRVTLPHLYPGQNKTTEDRFLMDPLNVGSCTVKWTRHGAYSVRVDKIHLLRGSYTLFIKSKWGKEIRFVPFETKELKLGHNTYKADFDKHTYTLWLARYPVKLLQ